MFKSSALAPFIAALWGASSAAQTAPVADSIPLPERQRIVATMDAHVRKYFAHREGMEGASYDSLLTAFRTEAAGAGDRLAFSRAAMRFTAGLRNGHTRFSDPWVEQRYGQTLWLVAKRGVDGWTVTTSEIDGLRRGDVITALDGAPLDAALRPVIALLPESGTRSRDWTPFYFDFLFPARFTLTRADGAVIPVVRGQPADSVVIARRGVVAHTPHRWLVPDSIAYVRVGRFDPASHEDSALAIVRREYAKAPALIVDVRGNGGGNTPSRLIRLLMADSAWRAMPIVDSRIRFDRRGLQERRARGDRDGYRGALVILTDHGCASSCEDFVAPFFDNHRATIVGDTTWGTTGQPRRIQLGHGMSFQVSARRYAMFDGSRFEGVGIPPHVTIPLRAEALRTGRDDALLAATELLRSQLRARARR